MTNPLRAVCWWTLKAWSPRRGKILALAIRNLHFDLADLPLSLFHLTNDRESSVQLLSGLKLLRATLDVKLHELRKVKALSYNA
jgi:hypothetical protein